MPTAMTTDTKEVFVTGLRNAHALETQAEQLIHRQLDRLQNYPQVAERLRAHQTETARQKERLDTLLARYGASVSSIKEAALGLMANMQALTHAMAGDEILKNTFANLAFENFEIATYKSLIAMATEFGETEAVGLLTQSLQEEERTAEFFNDNVAAITLDYLRLRASGQKADR